MGPQDQERGRRNLPALREILRLHAPVDGPPAVGRERRVPVASRGDLLEVPEGLAHMVSATGTDGPTRLPYRDD